MRGLFINTRVKKPRYIPWDYLKKWKNIVLVPVSERIKKAKIEKYDPIHTYYILFDPTLGKPKFTHDFNNISVLKTEWKSGRVNTPEEDNRKETQKRIEDLKKELDKLVRKEVSYKEVKVKYLATKAYYHYYSKRYDMGIEEFDYLYKNRKDNILKEFFPNYNNLEYRLYTHEKIDKNDTIYNYNFKTNFYMVNNLMGVFNLYRAKSMLFANKLEGKMISRLIKMNKTEDKVRFKWIVSYTQTEYVGDVEIKMKISTKYNAIYTIEELLRLYVDLMSKPYTEYGYDYKIYEVTLIALLPTMI
jgi:molecular chaperone GrpE (heat shock protein)